jgi:zinc transporter
MQREMNKTMYIFSLVAVLFLPLTFLTGLFGVDVGCIPGSATPLGFVIFCAAMLALTFVLIYVLKNSFI